MRSPARYTPGSCALSAAVCGHRPETRWPTATWFVEVPALPVQPAMTARRRGAAEARLPFVTNQIHGCARSSTRRIVSRSGRW